MSLNDPEVAQHRAAICAALDALESGDYREATEVLLAVIDGGDRRPSCRCIACGFECEWPGELEEHRLLHHPVAA